MYSREKEPPSGVCRRHDMHAVHDFAMSIGLEGTILCCATSAAGARSHVTMGRNTATNAYEEGAKGGRGICVLYNDRLLKATIANARE